MSTLTKETILPYYEKRCLVIRRQGDRVIAEARVRYLENEFRACSWFLERFRKETLQAQLGEAYKELMNLSKVKIKKL